jgi:hypothetical protein
MKKLIVLSALCAIALISASCGLLKTPTTTNNIGYQINNDPSSQPTIQIGSNGAQATGIYGGDIKSGETGGSPLVGNHVGTANRSTEADVSAALQHQTQASTQAQARDQSPQTTTATPTTNDNDTRTTTVPVSVGQSASTQTQPSAQ